MSVEAVFSATAANYNDARRKLIPPFDRFYGAALELLPKQADRVLELGAGTGLFSAMLRTQMPLAHMHLLDLSATMLEQAQSRFEGDDQVTFVVGDYFTTALPGNQDVIASALSIHHLEDAAKQILLTRIHGALRPGGVFVNADHVAGPDKALEAEYVERWLQAVRACGATDEEIGASLYRQQEDRRAPVEAQLQWLRDAGFSGVDCWFKDGSFAVMVGRRPLMQIDSQ